MTTRAWTLAVMTCALLLGAPSSFAQDESGDDEDGFSPILSPGYLFDPEDLEDGCTSMLRMTFVSFGGTIYETDIGEHSSIAYVDGEHHTTITTVTEFIRLILDPFGEETQELVDRVVTTEDFEEATTVEGILDVEWERDLIVWERIERTTAVPLPAKGDVDYADSDVVSSCEADESLSVDFPVYGNDYDIVHGSWYWEPYAPDTPEPEWILDYVDHEWTEGVPENTTYDEYRHAHCGCPVEVAHAVDDYLSDLHPVVEETIDRFESIFVDDEDESDDAESTEDAEATSDGEETEDAEGFGLQAFQAAPLSAKASAGGIGLAGLLGTALLALRRK